MKAKNIVPVLAGLAAVGVLGSAIAVRLLDGRIAGLRDHIEELETEAAELQNQAVAAEESYHLAVESASQAEKRLEQVQRQALEKENRLQGKIRQLQAAARARIEAASQAEERVPELEDHALAIETEKAIRVWFPELDPVVRAEPSGFHFTRPAVEGTRRALIRLDSLTDQLTLIREENTLQLERLAARDFEISELEATLEAKGEECRTCAAALEAARRLEANCEQRNEARAEEIRLLERKLFWGGVKTWAGVGGGVLAGVMIGRAL